MADEDSSKFPNRRCSCGSCKEDETILNGMPAKAEAPAKCFQ